MTHAIAVNSSTAIERIRSGLEKIHDNLLDIANAYLEQRRIDEEFDEKLLAAIPMLTPKILHWMGNIALGTMDKRFLLGAVPRAHAARLEHLNIIDQATAIDGKVKLLTTDGSHLRVQLAAMTKDQADQVFAHDRIRTLEEQRLWLEGRRRALAEANRPAVAAHQAVHVDKKKRELVVNGVRLSVSDLARYIAELG